MGGVSAPSGRPRGRPRGGAHVVSREQVLDIAEKVIQQDGPGASIEAIAAAAGVTKPVVYARVGDRADVANALAERLAERLIVAASEVLPSADGREALVAFTRANLRVLAAHRELFLFVTRESSSSGPDQRLFLAGRSAEPLAIHLAGLRAAQGRDEAAAKPWAYAIVGMMNMVALWWLADDDRPIDELSEQVADLMWSGIRGV
jgi:AcrR family transcriptional regulator